MNTTNYFNNTNKNLKDTLLEEFKNNYKNGLMHLFSCELSYHSNKIEGSRLSKEQTAFLFETQEICQGENTFTPKDIEEARGHFLMFNFMLKTLEQKLSQNLIKKYHYYLKCGVFEDIANGRPIGEYKNKQNYVGDLITTSPAMVEKEMQRLLKWYIEKPEVTICDLAEFHVRYEEIHPFADGNGRTGRIILFRESLLHLEYPIIINSSLSSQYKLKLSKAQKTRNFKDLSEFFIEQQALYKSEIDEYLK